MKPDRRAGAGLRALLLGCAALLLVACGNAVNQESFDKISIGMTQSQVEKILGSGTEDTPSAGFAVTGAGVATSSRGTEDRIFTWKDGSSSITVTFNKGVVVAKQKSGF